jgi:hypothetical protein
MRPMKLAFPDSLGFVKQHTIFYLVASSTPEPRAGTSLVAVLLLGRRCFATISRLTSAYLLTDCRVIDGTNKVTFLIIMSEA